MPDFFDIPANIRGHLLSPHVTSLIDAVAKKAEIYDAAALPDLVFRLVSREILPQDFTAKLAEELGVREKKAHAVTRELKEKVLEPIRYALVNWGVDINQIDISDAPTLDEFLKAREEAEKKQQEILASLGIETEGELKPASEGGDETITFEKLGATSLGAAAKTFHPEGLDEKRKDGDEAQPLMIHRENRTEAARPTAGSKSFSMPFGFFKRVEKAAADSLAPVRAKIESPKETERTVHYSELRTPLIPFQKENPFIHTGNENTKPTAAPEVRHGFFTPRPVPSHEQKQEKKEPTTPEIKPNAEKNRAARTEPQQPETQAAKLRGMPCAPESLPRPAEKSAEPKDVPTATAPPAPPRPAPEKQTPSPYAGKTRTMNFTASGDARPENLPKTTPPISSGAVQKKPWGFSLIGGLKRDTPPQKTEPKKLSSFLSGIKRDIDATNTPPKPATEQKKEPGPHVEGNVIDLR